MTALAPLVLAGTLNAATPAFAPPPAPPSVDAGRLTLAAAAGMPTHLATTAAALAFACSGSVIGARCDSKGIHGSGGAQAATYLLLATVPPLASGAVVWALGDDEAAPSSLLWTLAGGAAGQVVGVGVALATGSPALALLSLTAFPVAGELVGLVATRQSAPASALESRLPPLATDGAWLVPLASASF